ncbi:alpha/beta fold hydrolase [Maribacter sp. 2210JD10-5]|uniref:alpha/beta fold hydrolase n=1 Tax=Maribacter sp. 2210JD10-5 TaxID=3386272 RepID=UPI0039BCB968
MGLIGHSEGGIIALMVAAENKDVAFIVLMAGIGITGQELLIKQQRLIGKVYGMSEEDLIKAAEINTAVMQTIKNSEDVTGLKPKLQAQIEGLLADIPDNELPVGVSKDKNFIAQQVELLTSPWMQYFIKYDPTETLMQVDCPVLAINGDKDLQVPAQENLAAIKKSINAGGNNDVTTQS